MDSLRITDEGITEEFLREGYVQFSWINRTNRGAFSGYYDAKQTFELVQAFEPNRKKTKKEVQTAEDTLRQLKKAEADINEISPNLKGKELIGKDIYYFNEFEKNFVLENYSRHNSNQGQDYIIFKNSMDDVGKYIAFIKIGALR